MAKQGAKSTRKDAGGAKAKSVVQQAEPEPEADPAPTDSKRRDLKSKDVYHIVEWAAYSEPAVERDPLTGVERETFVTPNFDLMVGRNASEGVDGTKKRKKTDGHRALCEYMNNAAGVPHDWTPENAKNRWTSVTKMYEKVINTISSTGSGITDADRQRSIETIKDKMKDMFYENYDAFVKLADLYGDRPNLVAPFPVDEGGDYLLQHGPDANYEGDESDDNSRDNGRDQTPGDGTPEPAAQTGKAGPSGYVPPPPRTQPGKSNATVPKKRNRRSSNITSDDEDEDEEDGAGSRGGRAGSRASSSRQSDLYTALMSGTEAVATVQKNQLAFEQRRFDMEQLAKKEEEKDRVAARKLRETIETRRLDIESDKVERQLQIEQERLLFEKEKSNREEAMLKSRIDADLELKKKEALIVGLQKGMSMEDLQKLKELMS